MRLKPYDGHTDFAMWKIKMKAILVKEKCWKAVSDEWPKDTKDEEKTELQELAYSEIIIRLADDVARQVVSNTKPKALWDALESIYLNKSLPSRISLLCKLFTFKMNPSLTVNDNLDSFLRMTQDLERCKDKIKGEHQAVLLLNALPFQFDTLRDFIQYGRDELTTSKVIESIIQKNETLKVFKTKNGGKNEQKSELMMMTKGKGKKRFQKQPNNKDVNKLRDRKSVV